MTNNAQVPPQKKGLEVVHNSLLTQFMMSSVPTELKGSAYVAQSIAGFVGIAFIFASFVVPLFFFLGAAAIGIRYYWRRKTNRDAVRYRQAIMHLKKKNYPACIHTIDELLKNPLTPSWLLLIKASCCLEVDDTEEAYRAYCLFFDSAELPDLSLPVYWSSLENTILLAVESQAYELAFTAAQYLSESDEARPNASAWKKYYLGIIHIASNNYEKAIGLLNHVVQANHRDVSLENNARFHMGVAHWRAGQYAEAKVQFSHIASRNKKNSLLHSLMKELNKKNPNPEPFFLQFVSSV